MRTIAFTDRALVVLATALLWSGCLIGRSAVAQEFRIETDVFLDDQKEPVVETLTIFANGVVYDFLLTGAEEITLLDRPRNRLVLMDSKRKVKTELTMDAIVAFVAEMKAHMNDEQRKSLLGDGAEVTVDEGDGALVLSNDRVTYRAEGMVPADKAAVLQYQEFADWYARLNALRGNLPPFLRIQLNAAIAQRGLIPKTIERTIAEKSLVGGKRQTVRSQHLANWRLSNTDRKGIDRVGTYLSTFPTVTFREYLALPEAVSKTDR